MRWHLSWRAGSLLILVALLSFLGGLIISSRFGETPLGIATPSVTPSPNRAAGSDDDIVLTQGLFREITRRTKPGVVNIYTTKFVKRPQWFHDFFENFPEWFRFQPEPPSNEDEETARQQSLGSGMIIDPSGLILTNQHVIKGADEIRVRLSDGRSFKAEVVGSDELSDAALLRIDVKEPLPALTLGDSDRVQTGDWVIAIGNPFGFENTVTVGVISATKVRINERNPYRSIYYLQMDAAINPGNSGGPLLNLRGEVIGVNNWIFTRSYQWAGLGFAIPINIIKRILPQLREKGYVEYGYLGVQIQTGNIEDILKSLGADYGAPVSKVEKGTPAEKAGLRVYDVILEVNGRKVERAEDLPDIIGSYAPGTTVTLKILRDGKVITKKVTLTRKPTKPQERVTKRTRGRLGLELMEVTPELARQMDLPANYGLLVRRVEPRSPAFEAGLERGDVILEANRKPMRSVDDLRRVVDEALKAGRDRVLLYVWRRGAVSLLTLPLPEQGS